MEMESDLKSPSDYFILFKQPDSTFPYISRRLNKYKEGFPVRMTLAEPFFAVGAAVR